MARKPADIVQPSLRIREELHRRLEKAAKKRGVSLNYEMTSRLDESFDQEEIFKLGRVATDMETVWARYGNAIHSRARQEDLMEAAEALIEQLPAEIREREGIKAAVEQVQKTIKLIEAEVGRSSGDER